MPARQGGLAVCWLSHRAMLRESRFGVSFSLEVSRTKRRERTAAARQVGTTFTGLRSGRMNQSVQVKRLGRTP